MWSYLKSDLEELVSVVREDTGVVFEKIAEDNEAKKHSAALKEAERRMAAEETYTVPLLLLPTAATTAEISSSEAAPADADNEPAAGADSTSAESDRQVEAFMKSFDINARTDEISDVLEKYPDTVRCHFEALVPEMVRYEDFWERFFYRCDEVRIEREREADEERVRRARAELVGSVSSFFGVAAKAVASGVASALTEDDGGNHRPASSSTRGLVTGIFGPSGRPPFVMNTAVDEDDDGDDEDDEEAELGWDDEDEVEESEDLGGIVGTSVGGGSAVESEEQMIEFKDEALDAVRELLKQAMEERDQLHETVVLQTKEIASLKGASDTSSQLVEKLRSQLKAKETELFTLKQEVESEMMKSTATDEHGVNLAAKVKHLTGLLSAKELQLSKMQGSLTTSAKDLEESVASLKKENELLRLKMLEVTSESSSHIKSLEDEAATSKSRVAALDADLEATKAALASSQKEAASLKSLLERTKEELRLKEAAKLDEDAASGNKSSETHDTSSTGVKVDKPAVVSKIVVGGDDDEAEAEEAWGDEWD